MTALRLRFTHAGTIAVEHLDHIEDLAERVALAQLTHELNPVTPAGYTVSFCVCAASGGRTVAEGHFYVRTGDTVPAARPASNAG